MSIHYKPVECKSLLHHFNKKFLPFRWSVNPYRGCEHSCPYCFARYTHEYLGYNSGADFNSEILVKINAAYILERELSYPKWKGDPVNLGSVCDPYQPAEKKFEITRQLLKIFAKHKNPLFIGTKSNLILRDIDLLSEMAKHAILIVNFTITTLNKDIRRKIEPKAPSTEKRLEAVKRLSDAGIIVSILFMPIFPYLTDDFKNINGVVKAVKDSGAKDIVPGVLNLRKSCRDRVFSLIGREFPEILPRYLALYKGAYAPGYYNRKIYRAVEIARRKYGFKKFEMPVFEEKQKQLELWARGGKNQKSCYTHSL